ncbi:hypothetical protein QVD17_39657 [Tagetes erecta]|uniref:RNA-directed DNA polymerase, eukaryota, reverse transcriptase zinc-binding domain protein n=1 Tax=Tagetes erecta TaxID=13708 RepID=A0AAD8JSR4_TARER|nr:hypothetical protein QVD17_39657 [Tagetes erecta]
MGDSNVDSSNLARKVMKIDGNPRVNLLRGSSKGNDASKTNSSSRYPVRGTAVDSKMMINPKVNDHTADVSVYPAGVEPHPANASVHSPRVGVHPASGSVDPARVDGHPATGYCGLGDTADDMAYTDGMDHHTATVYTAEGDINSDDITNVIHESNAGNSYADMARKSGLDSATMGTKINFRYMLIEQESELLASFRVASLDEERFLKQKSKVHWLAEGDANTKYFHNSLKCRNHRARIDVITDSNGILHEGKEVPKAFVDHYVGFLGREEAVIIPITQELFDVRIDQSI